jgi:hypothetical protein
MSSLRVALLILVGGCFAAGWEWTAQSQAEMVIPPISSDLDTTAVSQPLTSEVPLEGVEPGDHLTDRYGNEIDRAVGDYRIDPAGDVYENHSPQTALPKLASAGA